MLPKLYLDQTSDESTIGSAILLCHFSKELLCHVVLTVYIPSKYE